MSDSPSTAGSVESVRGTRERVLHWLLLDGNRQAVAASVVFAVFLLVFALVTLDAIAIGPSSTAGTAFASGLTAGTLTLVTVALSINQLILSRVFGSPDELSDKLAGTNELRDPVREHAGEHSVPNDPAEFLSLVAVTLGEHAEQFGAAVDDTGRTSSEEVEQYVDGIRAYSAAIDEKVESQTDIVDVLGVVLGTEYALNMTATEHLQNKYRDSLGEAASEDLDAIEDLLDTIAVSRQFFKTLSLQQDFARLSRLIASIGLIAFLTSLLLALVYRTNSVTVPAEFLPLVFSLGIAAIVTPLAAFIAYILRAATIARLTVSVGPFVPPGEE